MTAATKPRVLFFVYRLNDYGGAAKQALKLANRLRDRAHIRIVNIQGAAHGGAVRGVQNIDGVEVHHAPAGRCGRFLCMTRIMLTRDYDIVHLHGYFALPLVLALLLGTRTLLKSTLLGDDDFDSIRRKRLGWFKLALAKSVAMNNALNGQIQAINRRYLPASRIVVIPNGVEVHSMDGARRDFSAPLFVFVGAIVRRKRPDLAIRYFIDHYSSIPGAALAIIGPSAIGLAEEDATYRSECEALAQERSQQIRFVGELPVANVYEYFSTAVALLFFSESEGMPNVVLEAMASNCVPITNDMRGVAADIIEHGASGFVVSLGDKPVSLSDIRRVGESGEPRQRVIERFSMERNAQDNLSAYGQLVAGG